MQKPLATSLAAASWTSDPEPATIDRARVEMELGRGEQSLKSLWAARRAAPEQTRYHPGARETIRGLVHLSRKAPEPLRNMAAWIGM